MSQFTFKGKTYTTAEELTFGEMVYLEKACGANQSNPLTEVQASLGEAWLAIRRADGRDAPTWADMLSVSSTAIARVPEPPADVLDDDQDATETVDPTGAGEQSV